MAEDEPIVFTEHARSRMIERDIFEDEVFAVVRTPSRIKPGNTKETERLEKDFPDGRMLVVIAERKTTEIRIVTVYWRNS